jgi:hypothetical protein
MAAAAFGVSTVGLSGSTSKPGSAPPAAVRPA